MEGGGGKGITYLGAIRALEKLEVLPLPIDRVGGNQIEGISGASAGAIMALLVAMGLNSKQIESIIYDAQEFMSFFDAPAVGQMRLVDEHGCPDVYYNIPPGRDPKEIIREKMDQIFGYRKLISTTAFFLNRMGKGKDEPLLQKLLEFPEEYAYNLIFDRGLFPGLAVSRFFHRKMYEYLEPALRQVLGGNEVNCTPENSGITFDLFYQLTGVDLVLTGANITTNKAAVFSKQHTPDFLVAEAVSISMNLPALFKPVKVVTEVPPRGTMPPVDYQGLWVDGGILNNFPLHAFDDRIPPISPRFPHLRPLNPAMLGLRLAEGGPNSSNLPEVSPDMTFQTLSNYLGGILNTALYPSGSGQIRTPDEAMQTIDLYTYELDLFDFAPPPELRDEPIAKAEAAVLEYFRE